MDLHDEKDSALIIDNDRQYLLHIFPEEIWLEILKKAHWLTKEAACNSSLYLRKLLYPTRQMFLFPQVYKLIGAKIEYRTEPAYTNAEPYPKNLWIRSILNLRHVCKEWSSGIENFYETCYPLYSFDESVLQSRVDFGFDSDEEQERKIQFSDDLGQWIYYKFRAGSRPRLTETVSAFLERFAESHGSNLNPFIGRCVVFGGGICQRDPTEEQAKSFLSKILELLGKYGKQIWFCTFEEFGDIYRSTSFLQQIREYLMLMPNLKAFRLDSCFYGGEELNALKVELERQGIPTLSNLELLSLRNTPQFYMKDILLANPHINRFEMLCGDPILNSIHLPNLRHLGIYFHSIQKFEMFETCTQTWPLLTLHVSVSDHFPFIPRERIFAVLEKWQDTLTDVMVRMPQVVTDEQRITQFKDNLIRLHLPKVKRFAIHFPNVSWIDFILPMKSLELLEVSMEYDDWGHEAITEELCEQRIHSSPTEIRKFCFSDAFVRRVWETRTSSKLSKQTGNESS